MIEFLLTTPTAFCIVLLLALAFLALGISEIRRAAKKPNIRIQSEPDEIKMGIGQNYVRRFGFGAVLSMVGIGIFVAWFVVIPLVKSMNVRFLSDTGKEKAVGVAWSPDSKTLAVARQIFSEGGDPPITAKSYIDLLDVETHSLHTVEVTQTKDDDPGMADITGLSWSPTQGQIAFVRYGAIWLVNLDNPQLPIRLGDGDSCAWSPDGKKLAIIELISRSAHKIYTLDVNMNVKQDVYQVSLPTDSIEPDYGITWSPDGKNLAFIQHNNEQDVASLIILDIASGKTKTLLSSERIDYPTWSPDGTMLAVNSGSVFSPKLTIIKVDGGSVLWKSGFISPDPIAWSPDGKNIAYVNDWDVYALNVEAILQNK